MKTKFGNVKLTERGYYQVTSIKEGNYNKFLHRLIWEDFYGCNIPKGFVIHHKNGNKLDNCILNLQLMRKIDHDSYHSSGRSLTEKTKEKIRQALKGENHYLFGKCHSEDTKQKISNSLKGEKNHNYGKKHSKDQKLKIGLTESKSTNTTGYFRVTKHKKSDCKQGFTWLYQYFDENGKRKSISSVDINKLEKKVNEKGLEWIKFGDDTIEQHC